MNLLAKQLKIEVTSDGSIKFHEDGISLMLLHKRSNEISNPADLLTTLKDAINRLDCMHRITGLGRAYFYDLFEEA